MAIENITVPDLGDATEVEVIELLVSVGQSVEENDNLLVLESDKAAMEIPAPMSGVVNSIAVNLGDQVTTGSEMLSLEVEEIAAAEIEESANAEEQKETIPQPEVPSEEQEETIHQPEVPTEEHEEIRTISRGKNIAEQEVQFQIFNFLKKKSKLFSKQY